MQVAQTKILRLIDNDGVGIRDVNSTLNNRRGQQYIIIVIDKVEDNLFQLFRLHLSVPDTYPAIRYIPQNHRLQFHQILNAVVHKENLPVAAHFKIDSFGYNFLIECMYFRLNRVTVGRRCLNDRQVSSPHQRELKGTRNRSSRQCQRIYIDLQLTKLFLHAYTELLLLVNDKQTQILEFDTFANNLMRTDKNIDFSVGQLFQNTACILCRTCPAQVFHLTRHILQTFLESLEVLVSQYRSRHQHRHLLVVSHCLKCSTDSDLRLTKTHVTTNKTVHRLITLHIRLYFLSSLQLVRSIFIQETGLQFVL